MQALVVLFCFSLVLATGTCLECEHCSAFQKDCSGKLKLCSEGQDTCANIRTETIIGKVSSYTIVKSCYESSKCLGSNNENSFVKVNVDIECSSSPAGKIESEGGEALVHGSNELPDNQLLAKLFNRPKSRAAADNTNPGNSQAPTGKPPNPPTTKPPNPPTAKPPTAKPPTAKPPTAKPPTAKPPTPKPPTAKPPTPKPPTPKPTTPKPTTPKPTSQKTTTGDAHQTVASFLLALSSLLLMNIVL